MTKRETKEAGEAHQIVEVNAKIEIIDAGVALDDHSETTATQKNKKISVILIFCC